MGNGTSIGRVRGLGSAHHGAHHWLVARTTAVGNLILMTWLIVSFVLLPDFSYGTVSGWISQPIAAVPMMLLIISVFYHAKLGLQVLIEDYVHDAGLKYAALTALNLAAFGGGAFALFSIARLALTGAA
ncbi:succinate dehydrogenase, hydrophobic membrane anchor protein [Erythrobacter sp. SCSIO 43205]|uniref:succinate dehydrogenase, hydrophobic membrane anchor protein n=1 Tax=Erythrobacter sp. SCSIO 43205 TaxID=2779361 RepID=UPI001CA83F40|nr:succinate dehydrogenase, hydrophobic membrane anchor protein [Erythrobacter sp. SCSIO 43205]UAB77320.1 succinate dehydrogenase, hydrophobic membrane anchor protein [Erythrobacter sp. SCSIO 43205]